MLKLSNNVFFCQNISDQDCIITYNIISLVMKNWIPIMSFILKR